MMIAEKNKWLNFDEIYTCPYCGSYKKLREYRVYKNTFGRIKFIECPVCNEKMRKEILTCNITPYEWGEWIYLSIRTYNSYFYKFHDKVHMDLLVENFKLSPDIANNFWDGYFNAKNEWNKGQGNKLLLEIELKMYPKKRKTKLEAFFSGKTLNSSLAGVPPDICEFTQKKEENSVLSTSKNREGRER